jgi:hypothetical protein
MQGRERDPDSHQEVSMWVISSLPQQQHLLILTRKLHLDHSQTAPAGVDDKHVIPMDPMCELVYIELLLNH